MTTTKNNSSLAEIARALREHQEFVIMSHIRPDGDALGCIIALGLCLKEMGKKVTLWNEDGVTEKYRFMPGSELVEKPPREPREWEVAVALDTASRERLGSALGAVKGARLWINVDHHVSNERYGDMVHIDVTAPAAGQIIYELIRAGDLPLTRAVADNLYIAISTDTGSFQYPNTTARTYEIAAELIRAGVEVGPLAQQMYESYPLRRLRLLGALLNVLKLTCENQVASFALTRAMMKEMGAEPEDNEGLIDTIRAIQGVTVAVFLEELPEGKVRISMRSKEKAVDVCKICQQFGGGGHKLAAGARIKGSLEEIEARVLNAICHEITN